MKNLKLGAALVVAALAIGGTLVSHATTKLAVDNGCYATVNGTTQPAVIEIGTPVSTASTPRTLANCPGQSAICCYQVVDNTVVGYFRHNP